MCVFVYVCVCVTVSLGVQHAKRVHHIFIGGLPRLYKIFPHYLINDTIFKKKKILNIKYVLIYSTNFSENFFIARRNERDMIKNVYLSSCEGPDILVRF